MTNLLQRTKKSLCITLSLIIMMSMVLIGITNKNAYAAGSGQGMANWAMNAYSSGWAYVWGGSAPGGVDCSGLIYSYVGGGARTTEAMISASSRTGSISSLPETPGIGLYMPGHVGVYIGGGMAVDARTEGVGVCYSSVSSMSWTQWFEISGVSYGSSNYDNEPSTPVVTQQTTNNTYTSNSTYTQSNTYNSNNANNSTASSNTTSFAQVVEAPTEELIQIGSTGEAVQVIQTRLGQLRFYQGSDSGYFGDYTCTCLKNFQSAAGLDATGIADKDTLYVMFLDSAPIYTPEVYTLGMSYEEIKPIQTKLSQLEYLPASDISGNFENSTYDAVCTFQTTMGIEQTGQVDEITLSALNSDTAKVNPNVAVMSKGATGEAVEAVQAKLISLRYTAEYTTGIFDTETEKAVKDFQRVNGSDATGILTRGNKELLYSDKARRSLEADNLKIGFSGSDVSVLQTKLSTLGYFDEEVSGFYDIVTSEAVKKFEEEKGLSVSGIATLGVRVAIDAAINSMDVAKTSNTKVSGLTDNSLAPNKNNVGNTVLGISFIVLALGVLTGAYIKIKKPELFLRIIGKIFKAKKTTYSH